MRAIVSVAAASFLVASCISTSAANVDGGRERAACSALRYLDDNGYLSSSPDMSSANFELDLWDGIKYDRDGKMDWARLIADRRDTFSNRMVGVVESGSDYWVFYKFGKDYACVGVDGESKSIHLLEANCIPRQKITRMRQSEVHCDPGSAPG